MADKNLVMTFLNEEGAKASIALTAVKDTLSDSQVSAAMDVVLAKNIFSTNGGDLVTKHSAQVTERNVTVLEVR